MVPQAWFVLAIFVTSIVFSLVMTVISPYYRSLMFNSNGVQIAYYFIVMIIMGILMFYSATCSVLGKKEMLSCGMWSWLLVSVLVVALLAQVGYALYVHQALKKNDEKKTA